jgi:K+/H+ antiporter YhaU regulatory subunit KhtT
MLQQKNLEIIDKNNELEAEFESEITNKNEDMRTAGQIIASVTNIYKECKKVAKDMKKRVPEEFELKGDNDPLLVEDLMMKLKVSTETIGDLIAVSN